MKKTVKFFVMVCWISLLCAGVSSCFSDEEEDPTAPTVVALDPENGAANVDASISAVYITFNEDMNGGYSISPGSEGTFPIDVDFAEVTWVSNKKFKVVLGKTLSVDTKYQLILNSGPYNNFKDRAGNSLATVDWTFTTAP